MSGTALRCRLGWIPNGEYAGFWLAEDRGLYRDLGISVEFQAGGPGRAGAIETLANADADLAITSDLPSVLAAREQGIELTVVAAVMPESPLGIAVMADSAVTSLNDLVGQRIGAGTLHDRLLLDALFRVNGLPVSYELKAVDAGFSALESGEVLALSCSTLNQVPAARRAGLDLRTWRFSELGLDLPADLIVYRGDIADRLDELGDFLAASIVGWREQLREPGQGARITLSRFGEDWDLDGPSCIEECRLQADLMNLADVELLDPCREAVQATAAALIDAGKAPDAAMFSGLVNEEPIGLGRHRAADMHLEKGV